MTPEEIVANHDLDPLNLLREWFEWWQGTDTAPHKLPNSLHVRSAMAIAITDFGRSKELQENCPHDFWKFEMGGRSSCRNCGADTTDMEAMGT